jgi:hypothetical protein
MAPRQKVPEKSKPLKPEAAATSVARPPAVATEEPSAGGAPPREEGVLSASSVAVVASPASDAFAQENDTTIEFDVSNLPLKTLDFWADNAFAILDYAAELSSATSVAEAIDAQSRFSKGRMSMFTAQFNAGAELARSLAIGPAVFVRQSVGFFAF